MRVTSLQRWVDRWNAFWFPVSTTRNLGIFRIILVATQLFWFFPPLREHLNLLRKNADFVEPQMFIRAITALIPRDALFTPSAFTALYWVAFAAGVLALVGLFTRTSIFVFALGVWIFVAHLYSYSDVHHEAALFCIVLLALAFAPSGDSLSLDAVLRRRRERAGADASGDERRVDTATWPLKLAHVLLAMTYFSTGMTKVIDGGPRWLNGYTLQTYILGDAVPRGFPFGIWLAQQHTLCVALSVFTIFFEVFFFLSLVFPWTAPFWFLGGVFFHIGLYEAAGHDFFQHIVLLTALLVCTAPAWWQTWGSKYLGRHRSRAGSEEPAPAGMEGSLR
jgi:Vitamin K-dependent gamma-carboxylase